MNAILGGPVMEIATRTGKSVIIHTAKSTWKITPAIQNALVDLTERMPRFQKMQKLGPLIQNGSISQEAVEFIYTETKILTESRNQLASNLGTKPTGNYVAHHYLPVYYSKNLELKFLQAGLDPNDTRFGTWMDEGFHQRIHGQVFKGQN